MRQNSSVDGQWFTTTHWGMVLSAGQEPADEARAALEELCHTYWPPLYAFVRQQGHSPEDAQDLTQEFFARFLERHYFARASPERGRFRTFLLTSLKHFLVSEWRKTASRKRGGEAVTLSWDLLRQEQPWACEPVDDMDPEKIYLRRWAATLIGHVMSRLRREYQACGHAVPFERLVERVWGEADAVSYPELSRELGQPEGTLRSSVQRLRQRCREMLREEVARTVAVPEEVDEELSLLLGAFGT